MQSSKLAKKRKRAYGISCMACRQKKRSCDGQRPSCASCLETDEECIVPPPSRPLRRLAGSQGSQDGHSPPPQSREGLNELKRYVKSLETRIKRLEESAIRPPNSNPSVPSASIFETPEDGQQNEHGSGCSDGPTDDVDAGNADNSEANTLEDGAHYKLTVDDTGNVTYHGVTGWSRGQDLTSVQLPSDDPLSTFPLDTAASFDSLSPVFRALSMSKHISVAPELGDALLNAFFCYQVMDITIQSAFLRDMALGGPYFSEFLLMVIYAMASRMIDGLTEEQKLAQGDLFVGLAKVYLSKELEGPSKIPTIQGLLLLSSRECALGDCSQGWNHAGLAFRMIQDLGIHLSPRSVSGIASLSLEERATRERIFWAAFIWDKTLSLALGREPTFPPRSGHDPTTLPDFDNDLDPWSPYFVNPANCPLSQVGYVYQQSRRVTAFRVLAQLSVIVHDILMTLYSHETRNDTRNARVNFVYATHQKLDELWRAAPDSLKFDQCKPSAPPHVFMLQMLHQATYILLHRPTISPSDIVSATGPAAICLEHSKTATQIAMRFGETFSARYATVARYSWFVAASFDVVLLDSRLVTVQIEAMERVETWLKQMEKNLLRAPSIRRSVNHIANLVVANLERNPALATSQSAYSIKNHFGQQDDASVPTDSAEDAFGSFDFFDLLQGS